MIRWFLQLIRLLELAFDDFLFGPDFIFVGFVVDFFGCHSKDGYKLDKFIKSTLSYLQNGVA